MNYLSKYLALCCLTGLTVPLQADIALYTHNDTKLDLLADGNSDGGERGAWWMSARKTFRNSFLTTLKSGPWKAQGFYLENKARFEGGLVGH